MRIFLPLRSVHLPHDGLYIGSPSLAAQSDGLDANALFTTTILSAAIATLLMALYAKLPFALAPSMGVNAFFVYTIVMVMGLSLIHI